MTKIDSYPNVSIIIPVYNAEKSIRLCLESLAALDYPKEKIELIFVDNGSTDDTPRIIKEYGAILVTEPKRSSYACRNRGVKSASHEIIAFTDADCVVDKDWAKNGVSLMMENRADVVGGMILPYRHDNAVERFAHRNGVLDSEKAFHENKYLPTACMFTRRSIIEEVDYFDEDLISGGDLDFCWRCTLKDFRMAYSKDILIYHIHRRNLYKLFAQNFRYGYGKFFLSKKFAFLAEERGELGKVYRRFLAPKTFVDLIKSFLFGIKGLMAGKAGDRLFAFFSFVKVSGLFAGWKYARYKRG
ncbi:glycosyltransferase [Thermodesulfobacteriota bacterium]